MSFMTGKPVFRPTWATVDLGAVRRNFAEISRILPESAKVLAMVKADAYGHGAVRVSQTLEECGATAFGVATVEEGMELRDAGISSQIVVMGGLLGAGDLASKVMVESGLTPVIHSEGVLDSLELFASRAHRKIPIHVKVDTGMSRLGVRPEYLPRILDRIKSCPHLYVEGVMTHLYEAGDEESSTVQMEKFLESKKMIESMLGEIKIWHIANSTAIMKGKTALVEGANECWVRPGLSLYGECEGISALEKRLSPAMGIVSKAVLLKTVPEGSKVSYGAIFTAKRKTRLAIVPIGYADGYPWSVAGFASVLIKGKRAPVVGRVTMDMIIVDVTDVDDVGVNDEVVVLGVQGDEEITLSQLAGWAMTIPYEILCGISKRMPRVYVND